MSDDELDIELPELQRVSPEALEEARRLLVNLMTAPYRESSAWDITQVCSYFEHEVMRPSGRSCICGHVKGPNA